MRSRALVASLIALASLCLSALSPREAAGHSLRFGVLRLVEEPGGRARLTLRAGGSEGEPPALGLRVSAGCALEGPPVREAATSLLLLRASLRCTDLARAHIEVPGLAREQVALAVRVERLGVPPAPLVFLEPPAESWVVGAPADDDQGALGRMASLGAEHLAGGLDHLAFVLLLALAVVDPRVRGARPLPRLALAITGFTLGHALTLALAALGAVRLPSAPVEACIALSIVLLAAELLREGSPSLTLARPALAAAAFGLLHGLGFAGALLELGLPRERLPTALLGFHLGIEAGQLVFVALLALLALLHARAGVALPRRGLALGIAGVATAWTALRLGALG